MRRTGVLMIVFLMGCGGGSSDGASGGAAGRGGATGTGGSTSTGGSSGTGGGTSIPLTCPAFDACGGSVIGTWKSPGVAKCGPPLPSKTTLAPNCPGYGGTEKYQAEDTWTFDAGGTYDFVEVTKGTIDLTYPLSCNPGLTCDGLATGILSSASPGASGTCVENASSACVCSISVTVTEDEHGTYSTTGGKLTSDADGSSSGPATMDYCVQGNVLTMQHTEPGSGGTWQFEYTRL